MAKIRMIKEIKNAFPYTLILLKEGSFYKEFGKDAIVMNYIFNYKIKNDVVSDIEGISTIQSVGFPLNSLPKILSTLEDKKIDYKVIDKSANYKELESKDFKQKNMYQEVLISGIQLYDRKFIFYNKIVERIEKNIEDEKMGDIINFISNYLDKHYGENTDGNKYIQ